MIRFLNVLALAALITSAIAAYTVKYETILVAEKLRKRETEIGRERDAIAVLQAEWQLLNRPSRLQRYARPEFGLHTITARQMGQAADVPIIAVESDRIDALLTGALAPKPDPIARATLAKTGGQTPGSPPIMVRALDGGTSHATSERPRTADSRAISQKAATTPQGRQLPPMPASPADRPLTLVPPAAIPAAPEPSRQKSDLSSLIDRAMGR